MFSIFKPFIFTNNCCLFFYRISTSSLPPPAKLQSIPQQLASLLYLNHSSSGTCSPLHPGKFYSKATSRKLLWIYSCTSVSTSWPTLLREQAHTSMTQSIYPAFYLQLTLICCNPTQKLPVYNNTSTNVSMCVDVQASELCQTLVRLLLLSVSNH